MLDKFVYYIELLSALCGFDGSNGGNWFGWIVVTLSASLVVAAFYIGITRGIWPGEDEADHVKRRILDGDED